MSFFVIVAAILVAAVILQRPGLLGTFLFWFSIPWIILIGFGIIGMLSEGK